MCFGQATIGLINEIFDVDIDRLTKPWRALPAGLIAVQTATWLAGLSALFGLILASFISVQSAVLLGLGIMLGVGYNARLKRTRLSWLPYAIAYPSLPVWIWVSLDRSIQDVWVIYLIASPLAVAVHMVNQLRDYDEDQNAGIRGMVHYLGKPRARQLCFALILFGPIPALVLQLFEHPTGSLVLLLAVGLHWLLVVPLLAHRREYPDRRLFHLAFRRLQISGPIMLLTWLVFLS